MGVPDKHQTPVHGSTRTAARSGGASSPFAARALLFWMIGITLLIALSGYFTDRNWRGALFLVVLPAFAAGVATVRQTAFAAGWVTLAVSASLVDRPLPSAESNILVVSFVVMLGALSVVRCHFRIKREKEIARLRSAGAALQRQLLRPLPVITQQLLVHGVYMPVEEDSMIGGDVYEVMASSYGTRVLIADVQGKGLPAIGTAFAVLGAFREAAYREPTLTAVIEALDSAVERHNSYVSVQEDEPKRFVTALVLGFGDDASASGSPSDGYEVEAIDCGHVPPYLLDGGRVVTADIGDPGVPLGLAPLAPEPRTASRFTFPADATLLLCTDGVTEAQDSSRTFYPVRERLRGFADLPAEQLATKIGDDLRRHAGGNLRDDVALLAVRHHPADDPPD